ncbi:beta-3-deoxy-D-manno-oct-2-ulosonic acid transferase [Hansschlegelia quercus]|uniref:Beta-3-deoxy-D-manno-oct-2-ulosonic acid transferase n=2 Tax=Hansschlegelia quercus TaxID=2528245 RepID=A0A4Q9GIT7_9HYPH|nr:beta-3-deoxy-D-manno-oct-2-ulosonic acid transferase [Hansschlegelia quercus]
MATAEAKARNAGAGLAVFAPAPLAISIFERARRPLCYRVTGLEGPPVDEAASGGLKVAVSGLLAIAPPGEIRIEADLDPADPSIVWLCPYTRRRISAARAIDIAGDALRHRARTARRSFAVGITRWKRDAVSAFLDGPNGSPVFADTGDAAAGAKAASGRIVVWASRRSEEVEKAAREAGAPLARLEDGFLRSVGLGSAFVRPASLVLDESGIYYDPSTASDLEKLLREVDLPAPLIARAAALRRRIVEAGATKYNVGASGRRVVPEGRVGVLVPGQVEDDASILRGAGAVRTNLALVAAVRARRPDAFIVYKPHPDVVAGYRRGAPADPEIARIADAVVTEGSIADLYPQCSSVETMTSLTGFEALLRGLEVTTHGQPFYAGWGLTEDLAPPSPRRGRARALDELVAAALILYPLYVDPASGLPCGPETALERILEARSAASAAGGRLAARVRHAYALARHRLLGPFAKGRL